MSSIDLGTARLAYVDRGEGAPVLLVHGSSSDYRTWDAVLDALAEQFRVISYSRRYHWPNEHIPEGADYSMSEHVDDLEALLGALDAAPAHLVGHSYGAFLCLLLAIRRPAWVRSLVLAEPPVLTLFTSSTPTARELLRLVATRPRAAFAVAKLGATGIAPAVAALERGDPERAFARYGTAVLGHERFQRLSAERREQARVNFIPAELLGSGFAPLDDDRVRAVDRPTLLMNGEHSPAVFHHLMDRLAELLPNHERVEIPRASHIMHEDNPAAWKAAVLPFLEKHP